jgi:hypothetical protein
MDTNLLKQFGQVLARQKTNMRVKVLIFAFFFCVASILWYLNKLSYEYSTNITLPLKFENLPKGKVMVGNPPTHINLGVRSFGYTLLRYRIGASLSPIYINLNQVTLFQIEGSETKSYILTSRVRSLIANQLKGELALEQVMPDTLFFEFTQLTEKKVKVIPNLSYSFDRQHMLSDPIVVSPDSVIISGPKSIIDTINSITTPFVRFEKISVTESKSVQLQEIKQIGFSHRRVNLLIPVERFTEETFSFPIEIRNQPDSIRVLVIPRNVNLKCNVIISKHRSLNSDNIEVFVDYSDVNPMQGNKLRVQIIAKPFLISNIDFEPKYVEYIIERL